MYVELNMIWLLWTKRKGQDRKKRKGHKIKHIKMSTERKSERSNVLHRKGHRIKYIKMNTERKLERSNALHRKGHRIKHITESTEMKLMQLRERSNVLQRNGLL